VIPSFSWDLRGAFGFGGSYDGLRIESGRDQYGVRYRERDERNPQAFEWGREDGTALEAERLREIWSFSRGANPVAWHEPGRNMLVWTGAMATGWTNQSALAGWARETALQAMTTEAATGPLGEADHARLGGTSGASAGAGIYQDIGHFLPKEGAWGTLTLSCYFREVDSVEEQLEITSLRSGTDWTARFDWTSSVLGVLASPSNGTAAVEDAGSGWYRASLTLDVSAIGADILNGDVIRATIRTASASPYDTDTDLRDAQLQWGALGDYEEAGAHRISPRPVIVRSIRREKGPGNRWRLGAELIEDVA